MDRFYELYGENLFGGEKEFQEKRLLVRSAALLHDIGHGPFSHVFEAVMKKVKKGYSHDHEYWTNVIVTHKDSNVARILKKFRINSHDIVKIINRTYLNNIVVNIVSSQFDADRMDYLQRDSLFTGVRYGLVDQAWLIHTLRYAKLDNGQTVIAIDSSKGKNSIINFILARRNLFQQVYFHHKVRAAEVQLSRIFQRIGFLIKKGRKDVDNDHPLIVFIKTPVASLDISQYSALNDFSILALFEEFSKHARDKILRQLCEKFINNKIFKSEIIDEPGKLYDLKEQLIGVFKHRGASSNPVFDYFHGIDYATKTYYENDYTKLASADEEEEISREASFEIWVLNEKGKPEELSTTSPEVQPLMRPVGRWRLCFDDKLFDRGKIQSILR